MPKAIYDVKAEYFKALGHPARIRILELLGDGECSVGELIADLGLEQSNVSQQLAVLRERGLIESRRDGAIVQYWIKDQRTLQVLALTKEILTSALTETRDLLTDLEGLRFDRPKPSRKRSKGDSAS